MRCNKKQTFIILNDSVFTHSEKGNDRSYKWPIWICCSLWYGSISEIDKHVLLQQYRDSQSCVWSTPIYTIGCGCSRTYLQCTNNIIVYEKQANTKQHPKYITLQPSTHWLMELSVFHIFLLLETSSLPSLKQDTVVDLLCCWWMLLPIHNNKHLIR